MWNPFRKAAPERSPADDPGRPGSFRGGKYVVVTYADIINAKEAMRHPVISRCVDIIAKSVQSVTWYAEADPDATAEERRGTAGAIKNINALLASPNDSMTGESFRYWAAQNYALYSKVPFVVGVGAMGNANALYALDASQVVAKVNNRGLLDSYEYGQGADATAYPIRRKASSGSPYLYEIAKPKLDGTIVGSSAYDASASVLYAIAMPAQIIKLLLQRAIDTASGNPNCKYVIVASKNLTVKQKEQLAEHLENMTPGTEDSGRILLLYNTDAKIEKLDNDLSDIHSKMPMDDMTRLIAGAMGIPIALVGIGAADAAKFAGNYSESRRVFWADTIIPGYLVPFATGMTKAICPPGVRIRFDYDTIDALRDHNIANAKELETVTFLSLDEKRELVGYAPVNKPETQAIPSQASKPATKPADDETQPSA